MGEWTKRLCLEGQTAHTTRAIKGIGIEICKVLAGAGADIAAVGRDAAGLREVDGAVEALKAFGVIDILVSAVFLHGH